MTKRKLAYIWSLRNAAADKAGQYVTYNWTGSWSSSMSWYARALRSHGGS